MYTLVQYRDQERGPNKDDHVAGITPVLYNEAPSILLNWSVPWPTQSYRPLPSTRMALASPIPGQAVGLPSYCVLIRNLKNCAVRMRTPRIIAWSCGRPSK